MKKSIVVIGFIPLGLAGATMLSAIGALLPEAHSSSYGEDLTPMSAAWAVILKALGFVLSTCGLCVLLVPLCEKPGFLWYAALAATIAILPLVVWLTQFMILLTNHAQRKRQGFFRVVFDSNAPIYSVVRNRAGGAVAPWLWQRIALGFIANFAFLLHHGEFPKLEWTWNAEKGARVFQRQWKSGSQRPKYY